MDRIRTLSTRLLVALSLVAATCLAVVAIGSGSASAASWNPKVIAYLNDSSHQALGSATVSRCGTAIDSFHIHADGSVWDHSTSSQLCGQEAQFNTFQVMSTSTGTIASTFTPASIPGFTAGGPVCAGELTFVEAANSDTTSVPLTNGAPGTSNVVGYNWK